MKKMSFREFLPYYRHCHSNPHNQWLHFAGATLFFAGTITAWISHSWWLLLPAIFTGYCLPHIGHKHYQGNQSLRSSHPVYCVLGATLLYFERWGKLLGLVLKVNQQPSIQG